MTNFDKFHDSLNRYNLAAPLTRQDAGEAFHNLTGFMSLLVKINEREKIVTIVPQNDCTVVSQKRHKKTTALPDKKGSDHED